MIGSEFNLAVACCRFSFAEEAGSDVHRWSTHVDWLAFHHLIRRHRVQSLAAQAFYRAGIAPPPAIMAEIGADAAAIAEGNLRSAAESSRLLQAFADAAIPLLFVKGLSLSALAYGDPFLKMSSDIDVLVDPEHVESSAAILRALGYVPFVPRDGPSLELRTWHRRHKESAWTSGASGLVVELHTRLSNNVLLIPGIGMSSPHQEVSVGGSRPLPTLGTPDLFAYLCVHGASSAWFRLKWIADLCALVEAVRCPVERLYRHALGRGAGRAPGQALLLADRLSLLRLPESLRREIEQDRVSRLLADIAFSQLLERREPTQRTLGTAWIHIGDALLLSGWRFKLAEAARQVDALLHRGG